MNITELSKQAISILALARNPEFIINSAKEEIKKETGKFIAAGFDKKNSIENSTWWSVVYREKDWWIEQNKFFQQYRLVGTPAQRTFFSVQNEAKLKMLLEKIIKIGASQNALDLKSTMSVYQVVVDEKCETKDGCIKILLKDATVEFPDTQSICVGFYTVHPCNPKALTPIENYFANLALDKENECIVLIGKFGAKSVQITRNEHNKSDGGTNFGANINFGTSQSETKIVDAKSGVQVKKNLLSELSFKVEFQGNHTDVSEDILKKSIWFKKDPQMNALLESLKSANPPKDWQYAEKNISEFNFDFNVAARILNVATASLKSEYEKVRDTERVFHVVF